MKLVYVHSNGNEEVLTEVFSNRSMTVEEVLEITQFDMEDWSDGEDYDYNSLQVIS